MGTIKSTIRKTHQPECTSQATKAYKSYLRLHHRCIQHTSACYCMRLRRTFADGISKAHCVTDIAPSVRGLLYSI